MQIGTLKQSKAEIRSGKIGITEVGELIQARAEICLHKPSTLPLTSCGHHTTKTTTVHERMAEIGPLQP